MFSTKKLNLKELDKDTGIEIICCKARGIEMASSIQQSCYQQSLLATETVLWLWLGQCFLLCSSFHFIFSRIGSLAFSLIFLIIQILIFFWWFFFPRMVVVARILGSQRCTSHIRGTSDSLSCWKKSTYNNISQKRWLLLPFLPFSSSSFSSIL